MVVVKVSVMLVVSGLQVVVVLVKVLVVVWGVVVVVVLVIGYHFLIY